MNAYNPISWKKKLVLAALTLTISAGVLEVVAGSMLFPSADSVAARVQVLAAQSESAAQIRAIEEGSVRIADAMLRAGM